MNTSSSLLWKKSLLAIAFILSASLFTQAQNVDCSAGPVNTTYCYGNNDNTQFAFQSNTGLPLIIYFNAGQVESSFDEVIILDSDGVTDLNAATPYGNGGDLTGLTYTSSGATLKVPKRAEKVA